MYNDVDPRTFLELVEEEYPLNEDGKTRWTHYKGQCDYGLRMGQAFMNALSGTHYYTELAGSYKDPYHSFEYKDILRAIDFLMERRTT